MTRRMRIAATLGYAVTAACACLFAADAQAITSCAFTSVVGVAFGAYDTFSFSPLDATGSVTLTCNDVGPSDTIVIDLNQGGASGFFPRQMSSGGATLDYNLYTSAAHTVVWGDGTSGTGHYGPVVPPEGTGMTVIVYGRLPARQNVPVGAYSDTITATILY